MEIRIRRGEDEFGPYSPEEARAYRDAGRIGPDDLAAADGGAWRPVDEILGPPAATTATAPYEPGGLTARFLAGLVDLVIMGLCLLPLILIIAASFSRSPVDWEEFLFYGGLFGGVVYPFIKDGLPGGRSIGKRITGLMVVHLPTNHPCTIWRSALRTLVILLTNMLPAVGGLIEPAMVLATKDHRRLGDRAAQTLVIRAADYRS